MLSRKKACNGLNDVFLRPSVLTIGMMKYVSYDGVPILGAIGDAMAS